MRGGDAFNEENCLVDGMANVLEYESACDGFPTAKENL